MNNLAQNRLIYAYGFGKLVLMTAAAENLKLEIREHSALLLYAKKLADVAFLSD